MKTSLITIGRAAVVGAALLLNSAAWATVRYVDSVTGSNNTISGGGVTINGNDCGDPLTPCQTIGHAVAEAVAGDIIDLSASTFSAGGTCFVCGGGPGDYGLTIDKDLTIRGQGLGQTIVDAGGVDRHFTIAAGANEVTIKDLTLQNGHATNDGGAVRVQSGVLTVVDSELLNNDALAGGAISLRSGTELIIRRSTLTGNGVSSTTGGAISCDHCNSMAITSCELDSNVSGSGGAIYSDGADDIFIGSTELSSNQAQFGGAIWHQNGAVGSIEIKESTLSLNSASVGDGGALFLSGSAVVRGSTFSFNEAAGSGGGIYAQAGDLTVYNSTFSGNVASVGGALDAGAALDPLNVYSSTFYGNEGAFGGTGGAIHSISPNFTLTKTIVTNSVGTACGVGGVPTGISNLIDDATCGAGPLFNLGAVTHLDPVLQNNGGPTDTHALQTGSNAINAGVFLCMNPVSGALLLRDQRDMPRPLLQVCDIGAFECQLGVKGQCS